MAIKKISEFTSGTPTASDKILFEQSGAGKSATIGDVGKAIGINMDLLWTNASQSSAFEEQTISLDFSKYKILVISFKPYYYYQNYNHYELLPIGFNSLVIMDDLNISNTINRYKRSVVVKTTGVKFGNGYMEIINSLTASIDNTACVPYQIYGVK